MALRMSSEGESERSLGLRMRIESVQGLSPDEFTSVFRCADVLGRHIVEQEARRLLTHLELPPEGVLRAGQEIHRVGRRMPAPGEVREISRGSWLVDVVIPGILVVLWTRDFVHFAFREYLHPVVQDAWGGSKLRDRIRVFLQERMFQGAKEDVESKAAQTPRFGNLRVVRVERVPGLDQHSGIEITLRREVILEVRGSDTDLIDDFVRRLSQSGHEND